MQQTAPNVLVESGTRLFIEVVVKSRASQKLLDESASAAITAREAGAKLGKSFCEKAVN